MKISLGLRELRFVERDKNIASMAEIGILQRDVPGILRTVQASDYCEGPLDDDKGQNKSWWVFGPEHEGETLYVKVCLVRKNGSQVECLSFHKAERPLIYPFRS